MTEQDNHCRMSLPYSEGMRKCASRVACDYAYPFGGEKFCALEWSYRVPEDIGIRRSDDLATHVDYILSQQTTQSVDDLRNIAEQGCKRTCGSNPPSADTKLDSYRQPTPLDLPLSERLEDFEDRRKPPVM